jgi:protease IV
VSIQVRRALDILTRPGENKIQADPFTELTSEQKALQEELMSSLHSSFIAFVEARRGGALHDPKQTQVFTGKVWTGEDAVKVGLIDRIGTLHEV